MLAEKEKPGGPVRRSRTVFLHVVKSGPRKTRHERPIVRGDCTPCPVCQGWRDSTAGNRWPRSAPGEMVDGVWVFECGHTAETAMMHSRPCIYVGCTRNNYLDVRPNGSVTFNHPHVPPEKATHETCAIDVTDSGRAGPLRVSRAMNLSIQGVDAIMKYAMEKLRRLKKFQRLRE